MSKSESGETRLSGEARRTNDAVSPPSPPRKRGRPAGQPHTGGKKAGSVNWSNVDVRDYFVQQGALFETLADIIAGRPMLCQPSSGPAKPQWRFPSMELRAKTAVDVLGKCWPNMQIVDQVTRHVDADQPQHSQRQLARAILSVIGDGIHDFRDPLSPVTENCRAVSAFDDAKTNTPSSLAMTDSG